MKKQNIAVFGVRPLKSYTPAEGVFNKHIASIILGRGLIYLCRIQNFNAHTLGFATEFLSCGEYGFEYKGVVYKLCSKSAEFRSLNKEFNDCFSSIKKHRIYLHTPLESTNNLIAFYLECLHSDLKAFVKMIGYKAENTSNLYRAVKKIKENT